MKKKNRSKYLLYFLIIIFAIFMIAIFQKGSIQDLINPTGGTYVTIHEEKPARYAYTLKDWVQKFFEVKGSVFPEGVCTDVAREFLDNCLSKAPKVTEQFKTTGPQRAGTLLFGIDQEFIGAIEMIYGEDLIDKEGIDSVLNLWSETVVRLPKLSRASEIEVTVYGKKIGDIIYIREGRVSTPMLDCDFTTNEDGTANCNCKAERTYGYENE